MCVEVEEEGRGGVEKERDEVYKFPALFSTHIQCLFKQ